MSSEGKRWGAEIFATERERELASEVERLKQELYPVEQVHAIIKEGRAEVELRRKEKNKAERRVVQLSRDVERLKASIELQAARLFRANAEVERLREALEAIVRADRRVGVWNGPNAIARAALAADTEEKEDG